MNKQAWEMKQEINYLKQELNRLKYHINKIENNFREQFEPKYEKKVKDSEDTFDFKKINDTVNSTNEKSTEKPLL